MEWCFSCNPPPPKREPLAEVKEGGGAVGSSPREPWEILVPVRAGGPGGLLMDSPERVVGEVRRGRPRTRSLTALPEWGGVCGPHSNEVSRACRKTGSQGDLDAASMRFPLGRPRWLQTLRLQARAQPLRCVCPTRWPLCEPVCMVSALWKQNLPSFLQNKQMQACPNKMGFLWAGFAENAGVTHLLG